MRKLKSIASKTDLGEFEASTMKRNLLPCIVAAFAVLLSSCATPGPRRHVSSDNPEPWRIYDLGSRNVIENPDYREPAPVKRTATKRAERSTEPRRVYNPMTQQFENDPNVRQPASSRH
jgi:hypothetical protein